MRDLLESVVDPSKVISDQYQAVVIRTTDGRIVTDMEGLAGVSDWEQCYATDDAAP